MIKYLNNICVITARLIEERISKVCQERNKVKILIFFQKFKLFIVIYMAENALL